MLCPGAGKMTSPPAQAKSLTGPASSIPEASSEVRRDRNPLPNRMAPLATAEASTPPLRTPLVPTPWFPVQAVPRPGHSAGAQVGTFGADLNKPQGLRGVIAHERPC